MIPFDFYSGGVFDIFKSFNIGICISNLVHRYLSRQTNYLLAFAIHNYAL